MDIETSIGDSSTVETNIPNEYSDTKLNDSPAPQFTNVEDNEIVHQKVFLVIGRAGNRQTYFEGTMVVKHEDLPTLQYPISNS